VLILEVINIIKYMAGLHSTVFIDSPTQ